MKIFMQSPVPICSVTGLSCHQDIYAIPVPICSVTVLSSPGDIDAIPSTDLQCNRAE